MADKNEIADQLGINTDRDIRIEDGKVITEGFLVNKDTNYRIDNDGEVMKDGLLWSEPTGVKLDPETGEILARDSPFGWAKTGERINPETGFLQDKDGLGFKDRSQEQRLNPHTGESERKGFLGSYSNRFVGKKPEDKKLGPWRNPRDEVPVQEVYDRSEPENEHSWIIWLVVGMAVLTAIIMAAVFVVLSIPIWGTMVGVALATVAVLVKRILQQEPSVGSWTELNRVFPVRRCAWAFGLSFASFVSTFMLLASDTGGITVVVLAFGIGGLVLYKYLDRFGEHTLRAAIASPRPALPGNPAFLDRTRGAMNAISGAAVASLVVGTAFFVKGANHTPSAVAPFAPVPSPTAPITNPPTTVAQSSPATASQPAPEISQSAVGSPVAAPPAQPTASSPDRREVSADGELFGFALVRSDVEGRSLWTPEGWAYEKKTLSDGTDTYRWTQGDAFVRVDVTPKVNDPVATVRSEEHRFQSSKRYRYELKRLRTGGDAYLAGVVWNFRLQRDDGPRMSRTIAMFNRDGKTFALSTGAPEETLGYGRLFSDVLNSLNDW